MARRTAEEDELDDQFRDLSDQLPDLSELIGGAGIFPGGMADETAVAALLGPAPPAAGSSSAQVGLPMVPVAVAIDLGPAPPPDFQQVLNDLRHGRIQRLERYQADLLLTWREFVPSDLVPIRLVNNKVKLPLPCIFFVAPQGASKKRKADSPDTAGWDMQHIEGPTAGGSLNDRDGVYTSPWNDKQGVIKRTGTIVGRPDSTSCWTFLRVAVSEDHARMYTHAFGHACICSHPRLQPCPLAATGPRSV